MVCRCLVVSWQWRRNYGDGGTLYPPSQRCGLCQNFKQTTLTTRLYKVRTNLYPLHLRKRSDAPGWFKPQSLHSLCCWYSWPSSVCLSVCLSQPWTGTMWMFTAVSWQSITAGSSQLCLSRCTLSAADTHSLAVCVCPSVCHNRELWLCGCLQLFPGSPSLLVQASFASIAALCLLLILVACYQPRNTDQWIRKLWVPTPLWILSFLPARRYVSAGISCGTVSVTSRCYMKRHEWINLVFGMEASFGHSYTTI